MIDYHKLVAAENWYATRGYERIEAPWAVTQAAMDITSPIGCREFPLPEDEGLLVASGEQSFLQLLIDRNLPPGKWMCITPCFRGDQVDRLHRRYFMKLELINTGSTGTVEVEAMMEDARKFFECYVPTRVSRYPENDVPDVGLISDLVTHDKGIELGSYGLRYSPLVGMWVYGTGCAEPRLSTAIDMEYE